MRQFPADDRQHGSIGLALRRRPRRPAGEQIGEHLKCGGSAAWEHPETHTSSSKNSLVARECMRMRQWGSRVVRIRSMARLKPALAISSKLATVAGELRMIS